MARIGQQKRCYVRPGQRLATLVCSDSPETLGICASSRFQFTRQLPKFLSRLLRHPPPTPYRHFNYYDSPASQSGRSVLPIQASSRSYATFTVP
ncbi:hypothetical protein TNCV_5097311 [Trichonephila clavipes]|nr:hypothetical protein TNCV_5097311 [Trichonephila clavipes]